jgi:hypothetical protein
MWAAAHASAFKPVGLASVAVGITVTITAAPINHSDVCVITKA